jgi:hypothetical protein
MFYTVIKLDERLCRRRVILLKISRVFSNIRKVLSQYKTWLSLLYLLYDLDLYREKQVENNKTRSSDKTANQSAR